MLRGIHKASANWIGRTIMGIVLGLIAVSFGIWGIGDIFRGFGTSTVAKVGGTEIRVETFRQLYQERLQQIGRQIGRPVLPEQARALGLDRQLLAEMIAETAIDDRTTTMRLGLSDAEVARQVMETPDFKGINGEFDRQRFEAILRNMGYTESRFFAERRRELLRAQLMSTIGEVDVPNTALDAFNRFQNEERSIEYVVLGPAQAGDVPAPTPEVLTKYFTERKAAFRAPEYRKITLAVLKPEDLVSTIEVSDADLKRAYEERRASFETPERRHLKQIIFPNMDEAKAAADKLAKGESFDALAAERGLKDSDIDLGTVAKTAVVDQDVANAAFKLKDGEVSAPIQGRFGIAIVQVAGIEPGKTKSLDELAPTLKHDIAVDRAKNQLTDVEEKVEDERLGGASLADAAKKFGMKPRVIDAIDSTGKDPQGNVVPDLPKDPDVLTAAFSADVHGENEPLRVPKDGGYVWYDVDSVTPAHDRTLDEVKDKVEERWRDDEIAKRLSAKAKDMLDKIKSGTSFADAVAADKLQVEWRPGIKRGTMPPGLNAAAVTQVFRTAKDAAGTVEGANPTERIVFHVTEVKVPPLDPKSADAKRVADALKNRMAQDLAAEYVARLSSDLGVTINQAALNQVNGSAANQN